MSEWEKALREAVERMKKVKERVKQVSEEIKASKV